MARLRARKHREERPFALMACDPSTLIEVPRAVFGRERPIVIAPRLPGAPSRRPSRRARASSA